VLANGFLAMTFDETTSPRVKSTPKNPRRQNCGANLMGSGRFEAEIPITVSVDTYFIVEAGANLDPLPESPEFVDMIVPGMLPHAFTNPIFVDLDGDGFDPPGLPVMASATGEGEIVPAFARIVRRDQTWVARMGDWWRDLVGEITGSGRAVADDEKPGLTGKALGAEIDRQKMEPSLEYFPLYHFSIPENVVEEVLERLPEIERNRIRTQRAQSAPR
jgi:hypothetical protein